MSMSVVCYSLKLTLLYLNMYVNIYIYAYLGIYKNINICTNVL